MYAGAVRKWNQPSGISLSSSVSLDISSSDIHPLGTLVLWHAQAWRIDSIVTMALPGQELSEFPEAYLTKVPNSIQRRERRWSENTSHGSSLLGTKLLETNPSFIMHENDLLYFDYGAVRLGRKPRLEGPDGARVFCVGLGWLPDWEFTVNARGLADITPTDAYALSSVKSGTGGAHDAEEAGVLGLLYKLVLDGATRRTSRSLLLLPQKTVGVQDVAFASHHDWEAAIPFHANLKVLRQVQLYMHVVDGGVGHKYQQDGTVVPFRTPTWPVSAVVHVDAPRRPSIRGELRGPAGRLQEEWVARELRRWIKDARLPPLYVEEWLREWVPGDHHSKREKKTDRSGVVKFLGFG